MDEDLTSCHLSAAICLFHHGTKLNGANFSTMKASIESQQLLSAAEAAVEDLRRTLKDNCILVAAPVLGCSVAKPICLIPCMC
jgi:hypothetical protein